MFWVFKKNKQNSASSEKQLEQTTECSERAKLIFSEQKTAGIRWEILLDGIRETRYCYFEGNVSHFSFGTEAVDGPDMLLNRDYCFYFYVSYDEKSDSYLVVNGFDGPFKTYPHGEKLIYGIDSFTLL